MLFLHKGEPSGKVGVRSLAHNPDGRLVRPENRPDLSVDFAQTIAIQIGSECEVLVESSEMSLDGLEVTSKARDNAEKLVGCHGDRC